MSRPRFLADQDLNDHIIAGVQRQEPALEFIRLRDIGMALRTEAEVLAYAQEAGLLVVSHDVNTMSAAAYARLAKSESFTGLLLIQQTLSVRAAIDSIVLVWSASDLEDWKNQVVFLPFGSG